MSTLMDALLYRQPLPVGPYPTAAFPQHLPEPARFSGAPADAAIPAWAWDRAEETLLADVDTYTEWLGSECMRRTAGLPLVLPSDEAALLQFCDGATVAQLVGLLLYPSAAARNLAANELRERYLAAHQGRLQRQADSLSWGEQA